MPAVALGPAGTDRGDLLVRGTVLPDWPASHRERIEPGRRADVRIARGRIAAVASRLEALPGEPVVDLPGAVVLPGLHDHHLHLRALVAAGRSARVGPDEVAGREALGRALRGATADRHGWRRAVGYHESVAGVLDRAALDALAPGGPLRVQHRSGIVWVVNSAGVEALGLDAVRQPGVERDAQGRPTGLLFRMDGWLAGRLPEDDPVSDVGHVSAELAVLGVTGVTDATPDATGAGVAAIVDAVADGRLRQRAHVMCPTGEAVDVAHPLVTRGPHKVLLDDDTLPGLDDLAGLMRAAHRRGVAVAVHCVTPAQLALTVACLRDAGSVPGDRIEHASVVPPGLVAPLAALGVTVVTNPGLVHARGDSYLEEVDLRDRPYLYPCASLLDAGVAVAAGTDAPFGPTDPWVAVRAARTRRTARGAMLGGHEAVSLDAAIGLFTGPADAPGHPRRIAPGEPGDLCLLADGVMPGPEGPGTVTATVVAGRVVYGTDADTG